jgi:hypothetical protein
MTRTQSKRNRLQRALSGVLMGRLNALAGLWIFAAGPCSDPATATLPLRSEGNDAVVRDMADEAAEVPRSPRPSQQTLTTQTFMNAHFQDTVVMRQAAMAGRLSELRAAASAIAKDDWSPKLRADYAPYLSTVRILAGTAAGAESLQASVFALGKLGDACADCHKKFGGPGSPVAPDPLDEADDISMQRHAAAADELWQGLIGPSDTSWFNGTRDLVEAPALDSDVADIATAARHLKDLAAQGMNVAPPDRARIFSDVLLTCGACHERLGVPVSKGTGMQ